MVVAQIPFVEIKRIEELNKYQILDAEDEKDFNDIVELASSICETPISLVSLVDINRQWFKAKVGLEVNETSRDVAFCAHTIHQNDVFIVQDASKDERFFDNPLVSNNPNIKFYAGMSLRTPGGYNLGSLCVIDTKPRELTESQINSLRVLGKQVIKLFELKKKNKELEESNELKNKLFSVICHDLKSPLASVDFYLQMLERNLLTLENSKLHLSKLRMALSSSFTLMDALFLWAKSQIGKYNFERKNVDVFSIVQSEVDKLTQRASEKNNGIVNLVDKKLSFPFEINQISFIVRNLITNSIKFTNNCLIKITSSEDDSMISLSFSDNGVGMNKNKLESLFKWSEIKTSDGTDGEKGTGFGLLVVQDFVKNHNGTIKVNSKIGEGSEFTVTFKKV